MCTKGDQVLFKEAETRWGNMKAQNKEDKSEDVNYGNVCRFNKENESHSKYKYVQLVSNA